MKSCHAHYATSLYILKFQNTTYNLQKVKPSEVHMLLEQANAHSWNCYPELDTDVKTEGNILTVSCLKRAHSSLI